MIHRTKNKDHLYAYLDPHLESGADELQIKNARKEYTKKQKAIRQKEYRKANKQYTIAFSKSQLKTVTKAATFQHRSVSKYIKDAVLAYSKQSYIVIDTKEVNQIRQLLIKNYCALTELLDNNTGEIQDHNLLLLQFKSLENKILSSLENPKPYIVSEGSDKLRSDDY